jgi:MerR family transcriptional regulator/heat shock protein HspR
MSPVDRRPLFMIGIAAELAGMHPQTLRLYERRGLLSPSRTARNTRLYSQADVARLRRIQELSEGGLNLAGIERVLDLERRLERAERRLAAAREELSRQIEEARRQAEAARRELEAARRPVRPGEIVVVEARTAALARRYPPVIRPEA